MTVTVVRSKCTGCGACLITCPTQALSARPGRVAVNGKACIDCLACVEVCPTDAISGGGRGAPGRVGLDR